MSSTPHLQTQVGDGRQFGRRQRGTGEYWKQLDVKQPVAGCNAIREGREEGWNERLDGRLEDIDSNFWNKEDNYRARRYNIALCELCWGRNRILSIKDVT